MIVVKATPATATMVTKEPTLTLRNAHLEWPDSCSTGLPSRRVVPYEDEVATARRNQGECATTRVHLGIL